MTDTDPETGPGADPAPVEPRRSRSRWVLAIALAVLVVAAGVVVAVLVASDDDETARRDDPPLPVSPGSIDAERQELVELLDRGTDVEPVHLRYEGTGPADDPEPVNVEIEVWRSGGRTRADTTTETPDGPARTAVLTGPDLGVVCVAEAGDDFSCEESDEVGSDVSLAEQIANDIGDAEVEVRDETIDGRDVRCYTWTGVDTGEVCVESDGVLARVQYAGTQLLLVERDDDVPADIFEPPA